jgi:pimeloyl-ACP methyl ester carboxylesterase
LKRFLLFFASLLGILIGAGTISERVSSRRDAERFPAPGRLVDIGGRRLHLQCSGEGSPTVIFEAGGTGDSMQYASMRARVATRTRACTYDRAGMGWSDPRDEALDARALAGDLDRLLRAADLPPPYVFVAGSAGGLTVELYAREHRVNVAGLVWLDALTGEIADDLADADGFLVRRATLARALANVGVIRFFDPHGFAALPEQEREPAMARTYHRNPWNATHSIVVSRESSVRVLRQAPPLRDDVPLVVVVHDRAEGAQAQPGVSPRWRAAQARFAARSRRGKLVVAEGSGHHPEQDRPDLVEAAIVEVLDSK